jgi:hypothetical protein
MASRVSESKGFVGEEACCAAGEAGSAGVGLGADQAAGGKQVVAADEDGLDGAVVRAVVGEARSQAASSRAAPYFVLEVKTPWAARRRSLITVREEALDEPGAGRPDTAACCRHQARSWAKKVRASAADGP